MSQSCREIKKYKCPPKTVASLSTKPPCDKIFLIFFKMFANHAVGYFHFHQEFTQTKRTLSCHHEKYLTYIIYISIFNRHIKVDLTHWIIMKKKSRHTWVKLLLGSTRNKFSIENSGISVTGDFFPLNDCEIPINGHLFNIWRYINFLWGFMFWTYVSPQRPITCVWIIQDAPCR